MTHVVNASVLQTGAAGLYTLGDVLDTRTKFIIDTGASVSIISQRIYDRIECNEKPRLMKCPEKLMLADGSDLPVLGMIDVPLRLTSITVKHRFLVCCIESEGLLGFDFFKRNKCDLLYEAEALVVRGVQVPITEERGENRSYRVTSYRTVTVPAWTEMVVEGRINKRGTSTSHGVVEPLKSFHSKTNLMIGRLLVDSSKPTVPIRVMNASNEDQILYKDTGMAIVQPGILLSAVNEVQANQLIQGVKISEKTTTEVPSSKDDVSVRNSEECLPEHEVPKPDVDVPVCGPLPSHLNDLWMRSCEGLTTEQQLKVRNMLMVYCCVFSSGPNDIGRTGLVKHSIDTGNNKPVKLPPRRVPMHLQEAVDEEIDRLIEMDIIRPSKSPWSSCIVSVIKPDKSVRLCLDVRAVNARSVHDSFPLPRINQCLDSLQGAEYFSTLDLSQGFHQILLEPEDACKTAFATPRRGLFQYVTLPYGLQGGPATCQRLMELVMAGLQWKTVLIYMDDLISYGGCFDKSFDNLCEVLHRLLKANLKVKPKKCIFFQKAVGFLGHRVSKEGVATDPNKIEKVRSWPTPQNLTETKSFLGLCAYYKNFIPSYSEIAHPLNRLSQKGVEFVWDDDCDSAFRTLKDKLTSSPILAFPCDEGMFVLDTDASNFSIGAVLSQVQDGEERVLAFGSKSLSKSERRYCVTRREMLAVVYFVKYYKHFLLGKKFLLRTDHSSLRWMFNFRSPEDQVARWLEVLNTFNFDIEHRPGLKHGNADAMSRLPCRQCGEGVPDSEIDCSEDRRSKAREIARVHKQSRLQSSKVKAIRRVKSGRKENYMDRLTYGSQLWGSFLFDEGKSIDATKDQLATDEMLEVNSHSEMLDGYSEEGSDDDGSAEAEEESNVTTGKEEPVCNRQVQGLGYMASDEDSDSTPQRERRRRTHMRQPRKVRQVIHPVAQDQQPNWIGSYSAQDMTKLQLEDSRIAYALQRLTAGEDKPTWDEISRESPAVKKLCSGWETLKLVEGVLHREYYKEGLTNPILQLVLPKALVSNVLSSVHDAPTGGHLGRDKTVGAVQERFYWYGYQTDVSNWCASCEKCASRKPNPEKKRATLLPYVLGAPLERVQIDTSGPWPVTPRGNRHILVITDYFTKHVEALPVPNLEARTLAECIVNEYFSRYGMPRIIHSDKGSGFMSQLFSEMLSLLGVHKTSSTPNHARSAGLVERFNATLESMLSMVVKEDQTDWDLHLNLATSAYRSTPHPSLKGLTPNQMMFGRNLDLPLDLIIGRPKDPYHPQENAYCAKLREKLESIHTKARKCLRDTAVLQERGYNVNARDKPLPIGSRVWVHQNKTKKGRSPKLRRPWEGPFTILGTIGDRVYKVRLNPRAKVKYIHRDRMEPYRNPNPRPRWDETASASEGESSADHMSPGSNDLNETLAYGVDVNAPVSALDEPQRDNAITSDSCDTSDDQRELRPTRAGRIPKRPKRYDF